jgi:uncharacterized protein YcnI
MRRFAHGLALAAMTAAGLGLLAIPASAHVTVSPDTAAKGGYATLTFKVPTERDNASTTVVEVDFPENQPLPGASVQPKSGWDYKVEKVPLPTPITSPDGDQITDRVSKITWTAKDGTGIKPGEFDTFPVSAGPLPKDADSMVFKAIQTYSNGEIVRWIEEAAPGSAEPKNPAPKITLTDAAASGASATPGATAAATSPDLQKAIDNANAAADAANKAVKDMNASMTSTSSTAAASDAPTKNQVNTAVGLAIGAIVLALVGAGIGGAALSRRGQGGGAPPIPPAPPAPPAF